MSTEKVLNIIYYISLFFLLPILFIFFFAIGFFVGMEYDSMEFNHEHIAICMKYGGSKDSCKGEVY